MTRRILSPNAARIANEVGGAIKELYDREGLTCYREEFEIESSGQQMVREGYIKYQTLPNGRVLTTMIPTRVMVRKEAEDNE